MNFKKFGESIVGILGIGVYVFLIVAVLILIVKFSMILWGW